MKIAAVIPVRYASTRFHGKPLALFQGRPIVQHVFEAAQKASLIDDIFIATDDERIEEVCKKMGAKVVQTDPKHRCGSERVAEVSQNISADILINIQGDQPLIASRTIDQVASVLVNEKDLKMSSAASSFETVEQFLNPNVVKVVTDLNGIALYFSRYPLPFRNQIWKKTNNWSDLFGSYSIENLKEMNVKHHLGIYGYKREILEGYRVWHPTRLEKEEDLEQLRALEHGIRMKMVHAKENSPSIDTPEDLKKLNEAVQ
ncbi:MAG: hypothetical protein A3B70_07065 [Deltaproteobacteria bacterium RIFCSPHIGHO2_02_FULL_40_11]|nr:MAG: hypothetical protein A3B70_07065 [Deltaproteobacteria bacterium RIFCSPHIGHO2_02_FULL_40_11]